MNGLTAKRLRQLAHTIAIAQGMNPAEGYNQYNQESNCISWEPAYKDGHRHDFDEPENNVGHERMKDPDGVPLLGSYYKPGTLHHAHKVTVLYKHLKKLWRATNGRHEIFGRKFRKIHRQYVPATEAG
jgi:hypothetical protein